LYYTFRMTVGALLVPEAEDEVRSWKAFQAAFPLSVAAIPVLGPVEHAEDLLTRDTIQKGLNTQPSIAPFSKLLASFSGQLRHVRELNTGHVARDGHHDTRDCRA
jgi:hypothetical protein